MTPKLLLALPIAALLAGCGFTQDVKSTLYAAGADVGNRYCETRDESLREIALTRINAGLREEGAKFDFEGAVTCDPVE